MAAIRPYRPTSDESAVFALWQAALGETWPLTRAMFANIIKASTTGEPGTHFVATSQGRIVGFVGSGIYSTPFGTIGYIPALFVAPAMQRRGIGTALHDAALDHLRAAGAQHLRLGDSLIRFWPGVPCNLPAALAFFAARGWTYGETTYDLLLDLGTYATPVALRSRLAAAPFHLTPASAGDLPALLEFQDREFPFWAASYREAARLGNYNDAVLARDAAGRLVGALLLVTPQSHPDRTNAPWTALFPRLGGLGEVGVAAERRGEGIGLCLVARGTEILRERGATHAFVGWTGIVDFYGRLGYSIWRDYRQTLREA